MVVYVEDVDCVMVMFDVIGVEVFFGSVLFELLCDIVNCECMDVVSVVDGGLGYYLYVLLELKIFEDVWDIWFCVSVEKQLCDVLDKVLVNVGLLNLSSFVYWLLLLMCEVFFDYLWQFLLYVDVFLWLECMSGDGVVGGYEVVCGGGKVVWGKVCQLLQW